MGVLFEEEDEDDAHLASPFGGALLDLNLNYPLPSERGPPVTYI